jgi:hypothetical protein
MTIKDLKKDIIEKGYSFDIVEFEDEFPNESYCIRKYDEGWETYYSERGQKSGRSYFDNESDACKNLMEKI